MIFNDVDKTKPYTVLFVTEPVRLACLGFAGFARGIYYIQGDFRPKISKRQDLRLVEAGLVSLQYFGPDEKKAEPRQEVVAPPDVVVPQPVKAGVQAPDYDSGSHSRPRVYGLGKQAEIVGVDPSVFNDGSIVQDAPVSCSSNKILDEGEPFVVEGLDDEVVTTSGSSVNTVEFTNVEAPVVEAVGSSEPAPVDSADVTETAEPVATEPQPAVEPTPEPVVEQPIDPSKAVTEQVPVEVRARRGGRPRKDAGDVAGQVSGEVKRRRGGRPRRVEAVAPEPPAPKLEPHDQDSTSSDTGAPVPEAREPDQASQALAG